MAKAHALVVHKSLISWIISKNTRLQVVLVITAIFAVFANVFPLEMQRRIINDAINLRKFDLLVFYCGLYLIAVIAASMLKYYINILQNIIFGDPQDISFNPHNLPQNEIFIEFLAEAKLREPLLNLGVAFLKELIKLSDHRSSDEEILELGLIDPEQIDDYKMLLYKVKKKGIQRVSSKGRKKILRLMPDFVPQKHHFFHIPEKLGNRIIEGRTLFKEKI